MKQKLKYIAAVIVSGIADLTLAAIQDYVERPNVYVGPRYCNPNVYQVGCPTCGHCFYPKYDDVVTRCYRCGQKLRIT